MNVRLWESSGLRSQCGVQNFNCICSTDLINPVQEKHKGNFLNIKGKKITINRNFRPWMVKSKDGQMAAHTLT